MSSEIPKAFIIRRFIPIESLGFIFNGILPATNRGTFMTLVYLNGNRPSFNDRNLAENNGQELLNYIRTDYERRF
jgi:hypothetical protein